MALDRELWADMVGLPYKDLGRDEKGIDCFGLVMKIYARRGIIVPDIKYGLTDADRAEALSSPKNLIGWFPCELRPGAVITFRRNGYVQHCGVCIDDDRFIHASEDHGCVVIGRLSRNANLHNRMISGTFDYAV